MEKGAELEGLKEKLAQIQEQLRQAEAELEDYRAREGASAGHLGDEVSQLRAEVAKELAARKQLEGQLHDLREKVEAGEARLKRQREEFTRRLEERDAVINEKDRLLDEHGAKKVDAHGLEAQVETLTKQLAQAQDRVNELESLHGAHAGATSKSGDLAKELKKAQAERDALREKQRTLESDLADAVASQEELHTQLDEKRKEVAGAREDTTKELTDERAKTAMLKEEFRKLKEEVVGLRARLRRLTDDKH
jgi:chromosome segregation ATPase